MSNSSSLKRRVRLGLGLALLAPAVVGCMPQLIRHYDVRDSDLFFVVSEGRSYRLGDCKRAADGKLTDCKQYEVEFK